MKSRYEIEVVRCLEKCLPSLKVEEVLQYIQSPFSWLNEKLFVEDEGCSAPTWCFFLISNMKGTYLFVHCDQWVISKIDERTEMKGSDRNFMCFLSDIEHTFVVRTRDDGMICAGLFNQAHPFNIDKENDWPDVQFLHGREWTSAYMDCESDSEYRSRKHGSCENENEF